MPVNCTRCGSPLRQGQRFCEKCGAPISFSERTQEDPKMDLSSYFDESGASEAPRRTASKNYPSVRNGEETNAPRAYGTAPEKSGKGLTIALLVCGALAIAVITFVLFLLFWPSDSGNGAQTAVPVQTITTEQPKDSVPPVTSDPGGTGVVIITPSPAPVPTPVPTPAPTPVPTPAPTAAPASDYLLPDSNSRYLTEADLSGLTHRELSLARNEIFARHGRIFETPQIADYFNSKSWYRGVYTAADFPWGEMNKYEHANISFIADYEKNYFGGPYNFS